MSSLGIYFGPKSINIVETKGKKLVKHIQLPQSALSGGELEEKASAEARMIELVALFKDELRKNRIEAKEATLCLSGQDLIIRTFEIPQLPREELASAINFEAKKYIPFKVEDLITDFQIEPDRVSRTNMVLFMGIKRDTLDRYLSLMSQVGIKISSIEHSAFSILRSLKVASLSDDGIVGVIAADLLGEDEVNFTVVENGFPLFSRDISLAAGPQEEKTAGEPGMSLEKLKTEIRISLDYYNRKFPTKNIKRLYLLCNHDFRSEIESFVAQIGPFVQYADVTRSIDGAPPFLLGFIKGFCASISKVIRSNVKTNLLTAKEKAALLREKPAAIEAEPIFEGVKIDIKIVLAGVLICLATFGYGIYRMQPVKTQIEEIKSLRPDVVYVNPDAPYEELTRSEGEFRRKLDTLDTIVKKQLYVTKPLNIIPRVIPKGVWLTSFNFDKIDKDKAELLLQGSSYFAEPDQELEAVNEFVANLKDNPEFAAYFKNISVSSIERRVSGKITATVFSIICKTN